jgi:cell division transport system permease protein
MFARRQEIRIMQLVGATNWFIRIPLILEGMVIGAVGALIAAGLIYVGKEYISSVIEQQMNMLRNLSSGVSSSQLLLSLMVVGAAIGALGSFLSIRRFLKA